MFCFLKAIPKVSFFTLMFCFIKSVPYFYLKIGFLKVNYKVLFAIRLTLRFPTKLHSFKFLLKTYCNNWLYL